MILLEIGRPEIKKDINDKNIFEIIKENILRRTKRWL